MLMAGAGKDLPLVSILLEDVQPPDPSTGQVVAAGVLTVAGEDRPIRHILNPLQQPAPQSLIQGPVPESTMDAGLGEVGGEQISPSMQVPPVQLPVVPEPSSPGLVAEDMSEEDQEEELLIPNPESMFITADTDQFTSVPQFTLERAESGELEWVLYGEEDNDQPTSSSALQPAQESSVPAVQGGREAR